MYLRRYIWFQNDAYFRENNNWLLEILNGIRPPKPGPEIDHYQIVSHVRNYHESHTNHFCTKCVKGIFLISSLFKIELYII